MAIIAAQTIMLLMCCYIAGCRPSFWRQSDHHVPADYALEVTSLLLLVAETLATKAWMGINWSTTATSLNIAPRHQGTTETSGTLLSPASPDAVTNAPQGHSSFCLLTTENQHVNARHTGYGKIPTLRPILSKTLSYVHPGSGHLARCSIVNRQP